MEISINCSPIFPVFCADELTETTGYNATHLFYRKVYFLAKYYVHVHIQGVQYMCYHFVPHYSAAVNASFLFQHWQMGKMTDNCQFRPLL